MALTNTIISENTAIETAIVGMLERDFAIVSTMIDSLLFGNSVTNIAVNKPSTMVIGREIIVTINVPTSDGTIPPSLCDKGVGGRSTKNSNPASSIVGRPLMNTTIIKWKRGINASIATPNTAILNNLSLILLQLYNHSRPPVNDQFRSIQT